MLTIYPTNKETVTLLVQNALDNTPDIVCVRHERHRLTVEMLFDQPIVATNVRIFSDMFVHVSGCVASRIYDVSERTKIIVAIQDLTTSEIRYSNEIVLAVLAILIVQNGLPL